MSNKDNRRDLKPGTYKLQMSQPTQGLKQWFMSANEPQFISHLISALQNPKHKTNSTYYQTCLYNKDNFAVQYFADLPVPSKFKDKVTLMFKFSYRLSCC